MSLGRALSLFKAAQKSRQGASLCSDSKTVLVLFDKDEDADAFITAMAFAAEGLERPNRQGEAHGSHPVG